MINIDGSVEVCKVIFLAKCASKIDNEYVWKGKVNKNTSIEKLLQFISEKSSFVSRNIYSISQKRLYPYHILIINGHIIKPSEFSKILIKTDVELKVIPFVSGG